MGNKKIVFEDVDGSVGVIIPAAEFSENLKFLAEKDVPEGCSWRIVDDHELPTSRNWRNAWTDKNPTQTIDVDLEKAKIEHKKLMFTICKERLPVSELTGQALSSDFEALVSQIEEMDFSEVNEFSDLYNRWIDTYDKRTENRVYVMHETA